MLPQLGCTEGILAVLGLVVVARWLVYVVLDVVAAVHIFVWAPLCKDNLTVKYGGKWAVVTGCTDGIGKEYARQLARRGMNILLISRNINKLNNVQQLIKEESSVVQTETVEVNFSHGRVVYPKIAHHLVDKDVGILVNNVGVAYAPLKKFIDASEEEIWNHVNVNVATVVAMTQLVLSGMMAKGRGAIINISSVASSYPIPYLGIYSATKAFVDFFSESLSRECHGTGITVQTLRPGTVVTNMTNYIKYYSKPSLMTPSPFTYVSSALATLGRAGRTTGYWPHGLQEFITAKLCHQWLISYADEVSINHILFPETKQD